MVSASCWEELPHHQPRGGLQGGAVPGWFLQSFPQAPVPILLPPPSQRVCRHSPLVTPASQQVTQTCLSPRLSWDASPPATAWCPSQGSPKQDLTPGPPTFVPKPMEADVF